MALAGWNENQKLKLIIDSSKVDENLTDFPVNITLSSGTGQTGFDATDVFAKLTTSGIDSYTKLLLHMDGDQSDSGHRYDTGGTPQIYPPTTISGLDVLGYMGFDGVTEYISLPDSGDWDFGTGNFTIDFWFCMDTVQNTYLCDQSDYLVSNINYSFVISYHTDNRGIRIGYSTDGTTPLYSTSDWHPQVSTWYHLALVRDGADLVVYIDGNEISSKDIGAAFNFYNSTTEMNIGANSVQHGGGSLWGPLDGYITEFRVKRNS